MGVENEAQFRNRDGIIDDTYRIDFISEHLYYTLLAREEGANCHGYMLWAFTDNVSPMNAFKNRYGLIEIDLDNQRARRAKNQPPGSGSYAIRGGSRFRLMMNGSRRKACRFW